jgi:5-methylcytosine-specific restriction endonuclease McrA
VNLIDATLEHIQPLSEGGNSHQTNLAISHAVCNQARHAKTPG